MITDKKVRLLRAFFLFFAGVSSVKTLRTGYGQVKLEESFLKKNNEMSLVKKGNSKRGTKREGEFEWKDYYLHQSQ